MPPPGDVLVRDHTADTSARLAQILATGREVVRLEGGEVDWPTAPHIVEAAIAGLRAGGAAGGRSGGGLSGSSPPAGTTELRAAIARRGSPGRGSPDGSGAGSGVAVEQVIVTSGARLALVATFAALLEPGEAVLVPDPGSWIYPMAAKLAGRRSVPYTIDPRAPGTIDVERIAAELTPDVRAIVVNSPHSPTGGVLDSTTLAAIAELAIRHDLTVIADETYARLAFEGPVESIAARPELASRVVVIDSLSKTYAMADWRLGYAILPTRVAGRVEALIAHTTRSVPSFVQAAGLAALQGPQECVREMVDDCRGRRDVFLSGLNRIPGVRGRVPEAGVHAFVDVGELLRRSGLTVDAFATVLLEVFGVAAMVGTAFGGRGAEFVRFSFSASHASLIRAVTLLGDAASFVGPPASIPLPAEQG